jgi:hypothetical protein
MENEIKKTLQQIEKLNGIKILFAVESGSRVWRLESKNSDYDVRFVFIRPKKDYLRITRLKDVVEHKIDDIDIVGFDIYKFMNLLLASNPTAIEWLQSDIVYIDRLYVKKKLFTFIENNYNPTALYYHYKSMGKQNYLKYIKSLDYLSYKKYLYAMRGLLNAQYVVDKNQIPPINFNEIVNQMNEINVIKNKLLNIIYLKKHGQEENRVGVIKEFDNYIEHMLKKDEILIDRHVKDYQKLQKMLFELLGV